MYWYRDNKLVGLFGFMTKDAKVLDIRCFPYEHYDYHDEFVQGMYLEEDGDYLILDRVK